MKRITLLLVAILSLPFFSFSGGIVHNTNQSASWVRMFARDASTDIDAVFYNPAGLTKLGEGFFISLNSQTLFQNREITSSYSNLNNYPVDYEGSVTVPVMPSLYASYNTGKFAFSLGINIIGGGGTAEFGNGLPSFEMSVADLVPGLSGLSAVGTAAGVDLDVTGYDLNAYLEGSSLFWGFQAGATYEINDIFSVFLGARYVYAKNTYDGYLKEVMVENEGSMMRADDFINNKAIPTIDGTVANLNGIIAIPDNVAPIITGGGGGLTVTQAEALGYITADQMNGIIAGLTAIGVTDPAGTTIQGASDAVNFATPTLQGNISELETNRATLAATAQIVADQEGDIEQTGTGITPIIGVNISPNDKLNIGLKYEFQTKLELENNVAEGKGFLVGFNPDSSPKYLYEDGATFRNDLPALLTVGVDYKITDKFQASTGLHYYFDKNANYGYKDPLGNEMKNSDVFDANYWEWALGLQYNISDKFLVSAGYLRAQSGLKEEYQTDLNYKISSDTYGVGAAYSVTSMIDVNLGIAYTKYVEDSKDFEYNIAKSGMMETVTETYNRDNFFVAIGLDFKFGRKSE